MKVIGLILLVLGLVSPAVAQNFGNIPPQTVLGNPSATATQPAQPMPAGIPAVATNTALAAATQAQFPGGAVTRTTYGNGNGAPPSSWRSQTGTCVSHGMASDGGGCQDGSDGNSFLATPQDGALHTVQFGADLSGAASASAILQKACAALNYSAYHTLVVDAGNYKIDGNGWQCTAAPYAQTANWIIRFSGGARLTAASTLMQPLLHINDGSTNVHTLDLFNPYLDTSQSACINAGFPCALGAGVALYTEHHLRATVHDINCVGSPDGTSANSHSEDCWTPVTTYDAELAGGTIVGFWNGGVYSSGDLLANNPGQKYNSYVHDVTFLHNGTGYECKFSIYYCKSIGNHFVYNNTPIGTFWAGAGDIEPPAANLISIGDTIKFTTKGGRGYDIASGTKAIIDSALIEDIGCDESGANCGVVGNSSFVLDNGAVGILLSNSVLRQKEWATQTGVPAILVLSTASGTTSGLGSGGGIQAINNTFQNIDYGLYESTDPSNSIQPSQLRQTKLVNVRVPIFGTGGINVPGTVFDYSTAWSGVASIAATLLCSTADTSGALAVSQTVSGAGVAVNTVVTATGTAGCGTGNGYTVSGSQTVASEKMTASFAGHTVGGLQVGYIGQIAAQSLAGVGSLGIGATSAAQSYPLQGAAAGDLVLVTPITGNLTSTPAVNFSCRGATNAIQCYVFNGSNSIVNFATYEAGATSSLVRLQVVRGGL